MSYGIIKIESNNLDTAKIISKRMAYAHEVSELIMESSLELFEEDVESLDWNDIINDSFAVRVKKINSLIDTMSIEKKLGALINKKTKSNIKVNLTNPETFVRVIVFDSKVLIGIRKGIIDKKYFFDLKAHKRPFFYPGSMSPKLARAMVNLAKVKKDDVVLDPFCGTGGLIIEAGVLGNFVVGTDIDYRMVKGTKENLEYYGVKEYNVFRCDARELDLDFKVNAVVTDPPYGLCSSPAGESSLVLFKEFLQTIDSSLAENGMICLASPHYVDINDLIMDTVFEISQQHAIRMHKSLTRVVSVLEKSK